MPSTRRRFLKRAATAVTLLTASPRLIRASDGGPLSLGFSLYGMKSLTVEEAIATCARIGYRNVELSLLPGFPTEPKLLTPALRKQVRQSLSHHGLAASALLGSFGLAAAPAVHAETLAVFRRIAEFTQELNTASPPLLQTTLGGTPADWPAQRSLMVDRLGEWNRVAEATGLSIAIKAHVNHAVNTPDRLLTLLRETAGSRISVVYDHSHFALAGFSIEESLRPLAPFTRYVHVKEATGTPQAVRFLLPGEGTPDFGAYFRLLTSLGYRGPVVAEVSAQISTRPGYDPVAAAERCH
ncbi:MAG: sugar phosphate isomerase/epimerase, partial [Opitutaceae bacterium]|nr:sugar phosphate isomerase/epimerase [Opitutaceae bacterium]